MVERVITVEVLYVDQQQQCRRRIEVAEGSTVLEAINASGIAGLVSIAGIDPERLGVFSRRVPPDHVVEAGDRIEIYRPLLLEPMEARRRRAR